MRLYDSLLFACTRVQKAGISGHTWGQGRRWYNNHELIARDMGTEFLTDSLTGMFQSRDLDQRLKKWKPTRHLTLSRLRTRSANPDRWLPTGAIKIKRKLKMTETSLEQSSYQVLKKEGIYGNWRFLNASQFVDNNKFWLYVHGKWTHFNSIAISLGQLDLPTCQLCHPRKHADPVLTRHVDPCILSAKVYYCASTNGKFYHLERWVQSGDKVDDVEWVQKEIH